MNQMNQMKQINIDGQRGLFHSFHLMIKFNKSFNDDKN